MDSKTAKTISILFNLQFLHPTLQVGKKDQIIISFDVNEI